MDLFQHRYYRLHRILMSFIGQWPYQSTASKRGFRAVVFFLGTNQIVPISLAFLKHRHEQGILLDFAPPILFGMLYFVKLIGFMCHSPKVRSILGNCNMIVKETLMLLNRIRTDWEVWARDRDVNILHQYAQQGIKMAIGYLAMSITAYTVFVTQPTIPKIIDTFLKNGTKNGQFPYPIDYYHLDVQKYYFYIVIYTYISGTMLSAVIVTHSIMLICYTQHVCGIFAALGHKLERFGINRALLETEEIRYALDRRDIELLAFCINRHIHAFEYANLVAASYTRTFFITVGLGAVLFNVIGLQMLTKRNDLESAIRLLIVMMYLLSYFFVECYISERLSDHSISLFIRIHNSQWYTLSLKAQKLLQFMTMRCSVPCQLTAGKMLPMSIQSWWLTVKTIVSYLMVVRSMQEF